MASPAGIRALHPPPYVKGTILERPRSRPALTRVRPMRRLPPPCGQGLLRNRGTIEWPTPSPPRRRLAKPKSTARAMWRCAREYAQPFGGSLRRSTAVTSRKLKPLTGTPFPSSIPWSASASFTGTRRRDTRAGSRLEFARCREVTAMNGQEKLRGTAPPPSAPIPLKLGPAARRRFLLQVMRGRVPRDPAAPAPKKP